MAQLHTSVKAGALVLVVLGAGFGGLYATGNLPWGGQGSPEAEQTVLSAPEAVSTEPTAEPATQPRDEAAPDPSGDAMATARKDPQSESSPEQAPEAAAEQSAERTPEQTAEQAAEQTPEQAAEQTARNPTGQTQTQSEPEPEAAPVSEGPDAPSFDVVRVEPDGSALIAGRAPLGSAVEILVDGEVVAEVEANHNGSFASFLTLDPSDGPRVLSLLSRRDGQGTLSEDQVIIAPIQSPLTVLAQDVGSETQQEAANAQEAATENDETAAQPQTGDTVAADAGNADDDNAEPSEQVAALSADNAEPQAPASVARSETRPQMRPVEQAAEPQEDGTEAAPLDDTRVADGLAAQSDNIAVTSAEPEARPDEVAVTEQVEQDTALAKPREEGPRESEITAPAPETDAISTDVADVAPDEVAPAPQPAQDTTPAQSAERAEMAEAEAQMPQIAPPADTAQTAASESAIATPEPAETAQSSAPEDTADATVARPAPAQSLRSEALGQPVAETVPDQMIESSDGEAHASPESRIAELRPQSRPETGSETPTTPQAGDVAENPVQNDPVPASEEPKAPAAPQVAQETAKPEASPVPDVATSSAGLAVPSADRAPVAASGAVAVLRAGADGIELLQPANPGRPSAMDRISLDTISYSQAGEVLLAGRAKGQSVVRIYLDNKAIADLGADESGKWKGTLDGVEPGIYTLRLDELSAQGQVTSRLETPFKREAPSVLQAPTPEDPARPAPLIRAVTVQTGDTLWAISRERYGEGTLYVRVFEANRDSIRDPDLIYPGQIFAIPD